MNIKSKLTLAIGILVEMIVLLVVLSVVKLKILTAHVYVLVLVCGCVFPHQLIILLKS